MKPCSDCPFKISSPLGGSPDWLKDVMSLSIIDKYFRHTCHKTDPKADGYSGAKKVTECAGHVQMLVNDIEGNPGAGGVYISKMDMAEKYLRHWVGDKKFEEIKNEKRAPV